MDSTYGLKDLENEGAAATTEPNGGQGKVIKPIEETEHIWKCQLDLLDPIGSRV